MTRINTVEIILRNGNIVDAEEDVVVSSIHPSKNLTRGPLSTWVHNKAGDSVQHELYNDTQNQLSNGQVVKTGPGNFNSTKFLLFCCLYSWRKGHEKLLYQNLRNVIKQCCDKAHAEGATSIAFPCLGTGQLCYPRQETANAMMDAFLDFMAESGTTSVKLITIVMPLKDPEWLQDFIFICAKRMPGGEATSAVGIYIPDSEYQMLKEEIKSLRAENRQLQQESNDLRQGNDKLRKQLASGTGSNDYPVYGDSRTFGPFTFYGGLYANNGNYGLCANIGVSTGLLGKIIPFIESKLFGSK